MFGWFRDQGGDGPDDLNLFGGGRSNFLLKLAHIRRVEGYLYLLLSLKMFLKSSANNRFGVVYNFGKSRVVVSFILWVMLGSPDSARVHLVGEVGKA